MDLSNKAIREINGSRPITDADWEKVKEFCSAPYGTASFLIDGFELTLSREFRRKSSKITTTIYINGQLKGEWFNDFDFKTGRAASEELRRFYPVSSKLKNSDLKRKIAKTPKREQKMHLKYFEDRFGKDFFEQKYYQPNLYPTFSAIKKHWLANNTSIEVIQINGELA